MSQCSICHLISRKEEALLVYEDEFIIAFLVENPANPGHIIVVTKKHYPIIENIPDSEISSLFKVANKISIAVFESLGMQGTNIIVQNGVAAGQKAAHTSVHIIPRREGDGLSFNWKPKQLSEEEMSTIELMLKEDSKKYFSSKIENKVEKKEEKEAARNKKTISEEKGNVNYLISHLNRIP